MRDDPAFNIKFLEVIEKNRVLYDYTMEKYSNRHVQKETWDKVSKELNESTRACKEKWKNIRSAFTRYLRHKKRKSGLVSKFNRSYYLADYLQFLLPFTKSRSSVALTENNDETNNSFDDIDETEDIDFDNIPEETPSEEAVFSDDLDSKMDDNSSVKKTRTTLKPMDPLEGCSMEFFQSKNDNTVNEIEDPDLQFLRSILPDMRQMNSRQKFRFKMGTMQLIGDILYNTSAPDTHMQASSSVKISPSDNSQSY